MNTFTKIVALVAVCLLAGCATPEVVYGNPEVTGMPVDGQVPLELEPMSVQVRPYSLLVSSEVNSLPEGGVQVENATGGGKATPSRTIAELLNTPVQGALENVFLSSRRTFTQPDAADLICECDAAIEGVHAEEVMTLLSVVDVFDWFGARKEYCVVIDCSATIRLVDAGGRGVSGGIAKVHLRVPLESHTTGDGGSDSFQLNLGGDRTESWSKASLIEAVRKAVQAAAVDALMHLPSKLR